MLDIPKSMPKEFPFKLRDYVDLNYQRRKLYLPHWQK
jgi:hypothetical protein